MSLHVFYTVTLFKNKEEEILSVFLSSVKASYNLCKNVTQFVYSEWYKHELLCLHIHTQRSDIEPKWAVELGVRGL